MPKQKRGTSSRSDKLDVAEQEAKLKQRQRVLWDDIQREVEKTRGQQFSDLIQQRADPDDRAVADMLIDLNESEITRDVEELRAVQYALGRIESGSYGICQSCGRPIAPDRLRAIPETALCIECQARAEQNTIETPSL
jgi:RNA polymerase-binding protein DksA